MRCNLCILQKILTDSNSSQEIINVRLIFSLEMSLDIYNVFSEIRG